jgi:hypothetical protein
MGQLQHFYSSEKAQRELNYSFRPADVAIQACYEWCVQRKWITPGSPPLPKSTS